LKDGNSGAHYTWLLARAEELVAAELVKYHLVEKGNFCIAMALQFSVSQRRESSPSHSNPSPALTLAQLCWIPCAFRF